MSSDHTFHESLPESTEMIANTPCALPDMATSKVAPEEETPDAFEAAAESPTENAPRRESTLELMATMFNLQQLTQTPQDIAQLALAGRSNVGKSSLLNALARRRQLAKVSSTPGKTRSVNLFRVNPEGFYITDLPGYGYAKRGKEERRLWGTLIETYLTKTPQLKAVVILLDCRLPVQEIDRRMVDFAKANGLTLLPVLTKADKCNQRERAARQREWAMHLRGDMALPVSAHTGLGISTLWDKLREAVLV